MAKTAKDTDRYAILHESVGNGYQGVAASRGQVHEAAKLVPDKDGHVHQDRLQRLLDLGAIAPERSDEAQSARDDAPSASTQG